MQLNFLFGPKQRNQPELEYVRYAGRQFRLRLVRRRRARRYILRLDRDGAAVVTVPRGGSHDEARQFVLRNVAWLEKQLLRQATQAVSHRPWIAGTEILFRGELVRLEVIPGTSAAPGQEKTGEGSSAAMAHAAGNGSVFVRFGTETVRVLQKAGDLRPAIEKHLWSLAARELTVRTFELAAVHNIQVNRVTVRNQRSRWGSCSARGVISLNWRLVQTPLFVGDYIVLHELAHVRHMNHSRRYWLEVERLCPGYAEAERWLKRHSYLLR